MLISVILVNKCAENLCKWTVVGQLIIEKMVTCFILRHSVESNLLHILYSLASIELNIYLNGKSHCCKNTFTGVLFRLLLAKNI